jgi:NTP pyrophosphatase (non-canonical NTP hydrolase)
MVDKTLKEIQGEIKEWADGVIPNRTPISALHKLVLEELPELLSALKETGHIDPDEIADVLIIAIDLASIQGIDATRAIQEKMDINRNRQWELQFGILQHVEE